MNILRSIPMVRGFVQSCRSRQETIALVPTMGKLHDGHLSLIEAAKQHADCVIASIFVNPTQFGPQEDLDAYPRDEEGDCSKLQMMGTDAVYIPPVEEMYQPGFCTTVQVDGITDGLCGTARPGHMDGVALIITKLFWQIMPDIACFGEKDYQQLLVIKRLAHDLDMPVKVIGVPTYREEDGLAMSSRNTYLTEDERAVAPVIYQTLSQIAKHLRETPKDVAQQIAWGKEQLESKGLKVDYLEIRHAETLSPMRDATQPCHVFAAAFLGKSRLIDNLKII